MQSKDIDRVKILEGTPQFKGSDAAKKQFYLDMISGLGKFSGSHDRSSIETLERTCTFTLGDHQSLGLVIDDAHLLFRNQKPKKIIKALYHLASMAQSAKKQFILIGNDELFEYANIIRSYTGETGYSLGWLSARMTLINEFHLKNYAEPFL